MENAKIRPVVELFITNLMLQDYFCKVIARAISNLIIGTNNHLAKVLFYIIQCESKKSPLRFSGMFSQTVGNF